MSRPSGRPQGPRTACERLARAVSLPGASEPSLSARAAPRLQRRSARSAARRPPTCCVTTSGDARADPRTPPPRAEQRRRQCSDGSARRGRRDHGGGRGRRPHHGRAGPKSERDERGREGEPHLGTVVSTRRARGWEGTRGVAWLGGRPGELPGRREHGRLARHAISGTARGQRQLGTHPVLAGERLELADERFQMLGTRSLRSRASAQKTS